MEIWEDIPEYESLYQASTFGRIRSIGTGKWRRERILCVSNLRGVYKTVRLTKNKKGMTFMVHQLVARTFLDNPENKRTVNHKNGDGNDNRLENLEWMTYSENHLHAFRILGRKPNLNMLGIRGKDNPSSIPVLQYSLSGDFIREWGSSREAKRELNLSSNHIGERIRRNNGIAYGYMWKFK